MEFFEQQQQHPGETNSQRQTGKVKEGRAGGGGGAHDDAMTQISFFEGLFSQGFQLCGQFVLTHSSGLSLQPEKTCMNTAERI